MFCLQPLTAIYPYLLNSKCTNAAGQSGSTQLLLLRDYVAPRRRQEVARRLLLEVALLRSPCPVALTVLYGRRWHTLLLAEPKDVGEFAQSWPRSFLCLGWGRAGRRKAGGHQGEAALGLKEGRSEEWNSCGTAGSAPDPCYLLECP